MPFTHLLTRPPVGVSIYPTRGSLTPALAVRHNISAGGRLNAASRFTPPPIEQDVRRGETTGHFSSCLSHGPSFTGSVLQQSGPRHHSRD